MREPRRRSARIASAFLAVGLLALAGAVAWMTWEAFQEGGSPGPGTVARDDQARTVTLVDAPLAVRYADLAFPGDCRITAVDGQSVQPSALVAAGDVWSTDCDAGDHFVVTHGIVATRVVDTWFN